MLSEEMVKTVQDRINLMVQDKEIQKKLDEFEDVEEAKEWITKVAIATLVVPVEERGQK